MEQQYLITLSSPIAVRTDKATRLVNVVEGSINRLTNRHDMRIITVRRTYDSAERCMVPVAKAVEVEVKLSNIRSTQEVA